MEELTVIVIMESTLSGKRNAMKIDAPAESILEWMKSGKKIQNFFPLMPKEQREFLISGCTPEEWEQIKDDLDEDYGDNSEIPGPDIP